MDNPVTVRTALLQALLEGPGYGLALIRRVSQATGGRVRLPQGSVYPALKALVRERLVRAWVVVPGRRRGGRGRSYYELTVEGVGAAAIQGELLAAVAGVRLLRRTSSGEFRAGMVERVRLGAELSDLAERLADQVGRARASGAP